MSGNVETLFDICDHKFKVEPNSYMIFSSNINQLLFRQIENRKQEQ